MIVREKWQILRWAAKRTRQYRKTKHPIYATVAQELFSLYRHLSLGEPSGKNP